MFLNINNITPTYRPEIDVIRAISVLLVFAFHTQILKSGYIGVDLFFVLSGFLISSIIFREISINKFSLSNFLLRRIRRIWPMLFIIVLLTIGLNFFIMDFDQYKNFSLTSAGSILGLGNFLFYELQNNYFSEKSHLITLLHTWSLSVEEQFYIFFSLFIFFLLKLNIKQIPKIIFFSCIFLSIILFFFIYQNDYHVNNFYLTQYRILPLILGIISAYIYQKINIKFKSHLIQNFILFSSFLFLCLYLVLFEVFHDSVLRRLSFNYSFIPSLLLCIFLIFYKKNYFSKLFFENKYLVSIGLISYSFYLIHFTFISFSFVVYENFLGRNFIFNNLNIIIFFFLSLLLSVFSWKFIENKFRNKNFLNDKKIIQFFLLSLIFILGISLFFYYNNGFPKRFLNSQIANDFNNAKFDSSPFREECRENENSTTELNYCILGNKNRKTKILLIGDSFMEPFEFAFDELGKKYDFSLINISNCRKFESLNEQKSCSNIVDIINEKKIPKVIISYRWMHRIMDLETGQLASDDFQNYRKVQFLKFVEKLKQSTKKVYVIYPVPEYEINVPRVLLMKNYLFNSGKNTIISKSKSDFNKFHFPAFQFLNNISNIERIFPHHLLCQSISNEDKCFGNKENFVFYYDRNHLTNKKAKQIIYNKQNLDIILNNQ